MSGYQPTGRGSHTSVESRSESARVALLLDHDANGDRLAEWLSSGYEIVRPDSQSLGQTSFDLCIVDKPMLEKHCTTLRHLKQESDPVFLPCLLISNSAERRSHGSAVWNLVDEVISTPTEKRVLHRRLTNLLERRELSTNLSTELQQQRDLFRNIFESSNDAVFIIDPESETIRECNPQACDLLGYSRDELLSASPELVHPDGIAEFRSFVGTVTQNGHGYTTELTCRTKDGEQLDAEISASALDIDGRPHMLASVRDVTTRHEQRRILNSLHDVTIELMRAPTKQDIAEVTTAAAQQVFGYDIAGVRLLRGEPTPETLELVAATDETYELLDTEPAAYDRGESVVGGTFERQEPTVLDDIHSDETPFDYGPIRSVMCLPLGAHGVLSVGATEPTAFDESDVELTNILATNATAALTRAQREEDLSERTERLSGLFENATDCIADVRFVDGAPRIRNVNAEFERVFGYDGEEIRGRSLPELVVPPEDESSSQSLVDHGLAGRRIETEGRRETATGRRDFLVRVVPIQQDGDNIGAYVVYTDITEQKRRDQQLQVLNRVLRHNIRNKLNIVQAVIRQALAPDKEVPETLGENGIDAVEELLDLSETARELSTETRPENNPDPVSTTAIVERTVTSLRQDHPDAHLRIDNARETRVAGTAQLGRALRELCENAIEHTDQADPSVLVSLENEDEEDGWVTITVEDDGPGIPDGQLSVLRNGEETQLEHGNGLGLWAVQWIVQSAGGELALANGDTRGTVVTMRLPTVRPDEHRQDVQHGAYSR